MPLTTSQERTKPVTPPRAGEAVRRCFTGGEDNFSTCSAPHGATSSTANGATAAYSRGEDVKLVQTSLHLRTSPHSPAPLSASQQNSSSQVAHPTGKVDAPHTALPQGQVPAPTQPESLITSVAPAAEPSGKQTAANLAALSAMAQAALAQQQSQQADHLSSKSQEVAYHQHHKWLLPPLAPEDNGKKCLVLDLDETLVHSSFKAVPNSDFIIPVEIDGQIHNVYVLKRPGVDIFLQRLGKQFEVVVFTASLSKYADPVLDMLDKHRVVKHRLFRESCLHHKGNYVKDLGQLGRDLKDVIILDNSPASYIFHPTNAVPISSWFNDPNDTELLDLIPFLEDLKLVDNVMTVLSNDLSE
ncbi:hypothetical protein HDU96_000388 [Phlyctochytrium bullatum]|nr:hypothetical protein HDU96_000388 [Phlyctochytrium bullatum]